jgi:hypothetical protein
MKYLIIPLIFLFIYSCNSVKITNHKEKDVDFHAFKTYSLYPWDKHNSELVNDYDKMTILGTIKNEMNKRGYEFVEKNGELVVSTFIIIQEETSYQAYTNHYGGWAGYGGGWGYWGGPGFYGYGWGPGYSSSYITSVDYNKGTLIIDVFNLSDKRLVWQGIASGKVEGDYDKRDKRLPMTIEQIFKAYPVRPGKKK